MFMDDTNFRKVYIKYFQTIFGFVLRMVGHQRDAENLTQETFIKIRNREIKSNPLAYLKEVARKVIYKYWREKNKDKLTSVKGHFVHDYAIADLIYNPIDPSTLPTEKKREEIQDFLRELVQVLPEKEKTIIELHYLTEPPLKYKEIHEILDITPPTCKKRHDRAIAKLRKEIERYLDR